MTLAVLRSYHHAGWIARVTVLSLGALSLSACENDSTTTPAPAPALPPAPAPEPDPPGPAAPTVRAEDVVDRDTLKAFVEAGVETVPADLTEPLEAYAFFDQTFRPEGDWRRGGVYFFVATLDGFAFFHAARPELEGEDLSDLEDANGVRITQEYLEKAAAGGGFVEFLWDDPSVEGDEETGSPKVAYVAPLVLAGAELILGAGFHPPVTTAALRNRGRSAKPAPSVAPGGSVPAG